MNAPLATYRLQLQPSFGFADCQNVLPYLAALGVSHIYASPVFIARPGSVHGYDVCDHNRFNPALGGEEGFDRLAKAREKPGLGWIQDIVPNHMAVSGHNRMLVDLLENGPASNYHPFFDIDWDHPFESMRGRMLAPFLGGFYGTVLENGEIRLGFDADGFFVRYYDLRLPLRMDSYERILAPALPGLGKELGRDHPDYVKLMGILYTIRTLPAEDPDSGRYEQIFFIKRLLFELRQSSRAVRKRMDQALDEINGQGDGGPERFDALDAILSEQYFRLSFWKVAGEEINYRRFFSVNELITLRAEDERVFEHTHRLILEKLADGTFSGLRVDHIDGLYDPTGYLRRLRERAGDAFIVVEKILSGDEPLPAFWPIQGTTGYDFANDVCGLFVDPAGEKTLNKVYAGFARSRLGLEAIIARKKNRILKTHMAGDVDNMARLVKGVSSRDRHAVDVTFNSLRKAIAELLVQFPVYRTYVNFDEARSADLVFIRQSIRAARRRQPELQAEFDFLERFLLLEFGESVSEEDRRRWIHFVMRFQQVTGPLMAKGLEDSTFYEYNRLLCLNEVGGDPGRFGLSAEGFHQRMAERASRRPRTMNATATHDHKRGEDARMRLAILAEAPELWAETVKRLRRAAARKKRRVNGQPAPEPNDEYFLFQTLVASLPFDPAEMDGFTERIKDYWVKALREGKARSSWINPDEDYERACAGFAEALLRPGEKNAFYAALSEFVDAIAVPAAVNSLSQLLVKLTAPGLPDIYQGTEFWDFSLVDPDNRRPVDFAARLAALQEIEARLAKSPDALVAKLLESVADGRIKLFLLRRTLAARNEYAELFREGAYVPLSFTGEKSEHLFGFARSLEGRHVLTIVPRFPYRLAGSSWPLGKIWGDTAIMLPETLEELPGAALDLITGKSIPLNRSAISAATILEGFPLGLLAIEAFGRG